MTLNLFSIRRPVPVLRSVFDFVSNSFVPPAILKDADNQRLAQRFSGVARMLLICIVVECLTLLLLHAISGLDSWLISILIWSAPVVTLFGLFLLRWTSSLALPLILINGCTIAAIFLTAVQTGGLFSPFVYLLMVIPAVLISFGNRMVFVSVCSGIAVLIIMLYFASANDFAIWEETIAFNTVTHFILLLGGFSISTLGGLSAQISTSQARHSLRKSNAELAEKNEMLEGLSAKLAKYLSPQVYESIFEGKQDVKIGASRKKLTVYFSDIVDFTATTDAMEAEDLANLMNEYFDEMATVILKHGGTIDKYIGDAIMVFFGDPETRGEKEDACACVAMALEMQERLLVLQENWKRMGIAKPLEMRAGINTGYCTVGNFGSENRMDYTIIGGQVNVAARLEQAAVPGELLISDQTYSLVNDRFDCEAYQPLQVKGIAEPVLAYHLKRRHDDLAQPNHIEANFKGMKFVADFDVISKEDKKFAAAYLKQALAKLEEDK